MFVKYGKSCFFLFLLLNVIYGKDINDTYECKNEKKTLQLLYEQSIVDSFINNEQVKSQSKLFNHFEASGVELRSDRLVMYVVFDNTFQIGAFCTYWANQSFNCTDQLLDWPDKQMENEVSEFEDIAYNSINDTYFIIQETIPSSLDKNKLISNIYEIRILSNNRSSSIILLESCQIQWEFESKSKGFEGLEFLRHKKTRKTYLLALCEANNCSMGTIQDDKEKNLGNGQIVVLEKNEATDDTPCHWEPVGIINLPLDAQFRDYSDLSIYPTDSTNYVAINSQEDSQLWIGEIKEIDKAPYYTIKSLKKDFIYNLPRIMINDNECSIVYCTIEGVVWLNEKQLVLVSDEAKDRHAPICVHKDQMIHYFSLT